MNNFPKKMDNLPYFLVYNDLFCVIVVISKKLDYL